MIKNAGKISKKTRKFNPEGSGYNYTAAKKAGLTPVMGKDGKKHWGSFNPKTGQLLKGINHSSINKTKGAERNRMARIVKKGKYYYTESLFKRKKK
jgi:hypothetical protein